MADFRMRTAKSLLLYRLQNKDTKKGTLTLISIPCITAIGMASLPEYLLIEANKISAEPIPAADIGARRPKNRYIRGAPINATIFRKIFANNAIVPNSVASCIPILGVFNCVINTEDTE